jgi:recombination protein RecA
MDIIEKSGAFYSYAGTKLGQGKMKAINFLEANPDLAMEIETVIKDKVEAKKDAGKIPAKKPTLKKEA